VPGSTRHLARTAQRVAVFTALAGALVFAPLPSYTAKAAEKKHEELFGTSEIRASNIAKFKKWSTVLGRYAKEEPDEMKPCRPTPQEKCLLARWRIFLKQIAKEPWRTKINKINAYHNRWRYLLDPANYKKKDYWATPRQFFARRGDCEDYAISKYMALKHAGFPEKDMRVVVVQDLNLRVGHAILVVYLDGKPLLLDNQIKQVIEANRVRHYRPIYSINTQNWWLHRGFKRK
jgi:predicted transglutaminase-like cysteine proteinase